MPWFSGFWPRHFFSRSNELLPTVTLQNPQTNRDGIIETNLRSLALSLAEGKGLNPKNDFSEAWNKVKFYAKEK